MDILWMNMGNDGSLILGGTFSTEPRGCTDTAPGGDAAPIQGSHRAVADAPPALIKGTV